MIVLIYGNHIASHASTNDAVTKKKMPNIVIMLVDDLGHSGVQWNNPNIIGPRVQELRDSGILLKRNYVYKFCSPTRGSFLSGRYAFRTGNTRSNFIPWSRPDGLNLGFNLLQHRLKALGYRTHHVGKWHLGFHNSSYLPVNRGFDTFYGYLTGMEDHFTERLRGFINCPNVVDLTHNTAPAHGKNGTYTGWFYNSQALATIRNSVQTPETPFFLNYWLHNTHGPVEVPEQYSDLYHFKDKGLNKFNGMVSVVDEAVGNITKLLKSTGAWNNTLVLYFHDNGAPLGAGGSNFPLRGGKNSNFEGGVRVPGVLAGGVLPDMLHNTSNDQLFHAVDWLPTLLHAATGESIILQDSVSTKIPYDGIDQWDFLTKRNSTAPRNEIVLDHCPKGYGMSSTGCNHFKDNREGGIGALIMGKWKLIVGPNGGQWSSYINGTKCNSFGNVACKDNCLFDLSTDESEMHDQSKIQPKIMAQLMKRFNELQTEFHAPIQNPAPEEDAICAAAAAASGFLVPWTPETPLGPCVGGPGDKGWDVLNNTGGGGPGFAHSPVENLGPEAMEVCRKRCCASTKCVSVTMHADNGGSTLCWLNPDHSQIAPFARNLTLMAFVKRDTK